MRVLLVDHDSESLETITRAIRGVLELDCVTSKGDALLLLRQNTYDVLIACERCVDGSGLDLLGRTTRTAVPLKRIFAAAPERLQLLGPRLAPFKVQRTINYPIDLEELWLAIAQVTSGPNDETDGTIERVVLDERGIPSAGTSPRAPITTSSPPRPPAQLSAVPSSPAPAVAAGAGRAATARVTQPAPEPPLRAPLRRAPPPPVARAPAPPRTPSDTGRMRALATASPPPPMEPMTPTGPEEHPSWTPESPPEDDFAEIAAQARLGVQQKVVDEVARRKRNRLLAAGGIALVVAGGIVWAIEKFYDPAARAREAAIAEKVQEMAEQQKVTDGLTLIEIDIENAIMANDLETARRELDELIAKSPDHPRRDFLQKSIERAEELARLAPPANGKDGGKDEDRGGAKGSQAAQSAGNAAPAKSRVADTHATESRSTGKGDRGTVRVTERAPATRSSSSSAATRSYGAPIGEALRQPSVPLDAPINAPPTYTARRNDNSFGGRTIEASDSAVGRTPPPATLPAPAASNPGPSSAAPSSTLPSTQNSVGSAVAPVASVAPPPAPIDVVPAKILKRVTPVAPGNIPAKTKGYVVVKFSIGTNGRVSNLEVVESQPAGVFDDAAQDAVRKWTYEPRKENGVAVESSARAKLVFDAAN